MFQERHPSKAFTLMELLVVVSIIVLLISLLFPYLGKSRELARRAVCASNVHNLSAAMLIYTNNNAGRIPLCFLDWGDPNANPPTVLSSMSRQFDYLLMYILSDYPTPDMAYGPLLREMARGYGSDTRQVFKSFYCPSQTALIFRYDNWQNPWLPPPTDPRYNQNTYTRVGYGTRPLAGWNPEPQSRGVVLGWPNQGDPSLPRYQRLEPGMAIVSDIVTDMEYTASSHVDGPKYTNGAANYAEIATTSGGVNFATAGGAVLWFPTANFNSNWQSWGQKTLAALADPKSSFNDYPQGVSNPQTGFYEEGSSPTNGAGVWFDMDKVSR
jgi:prepilin-type N-terminal cleavage/methylation domain-containing protein